VKVLGGGKVQLNTPPSVHPSFHSDRLRLISGDPLPSQVQSDWQPDSIEIEGEEEWLVSSILQEKGSEKARKYLVEWIGYDSPTWEPASALQDTEALGKWLSATGVVRNDNGQLPKGFTLPSEE
jgi:hypothetical protein